jgi:hypothetical protein
MRKLFGGMYKHKPIPPYEVLWKNINEVNQARFFSQLTDKYKYFYIKRAFGFSDYKKRSFIFTMPNMMNPWQVLDAEIWEKIQELKALDRLPTEREAIKAMLEDDSGEPLDPETVKRLRLEYEYGRESRRVDKVLIMKEMKERFPIIIPQFPVNYTAHKLRKTEKFPFCLKMTDRESWANDPAEEPVEKIFAPDTGMDELMCRLHAAFMLQMKLPLSSDITDQDPSHLLEYFEYDPLYIRKSLGINNVTGSQRVEIEQMGRLKGAPWGDWDFVNMWENNHERFYRYACRYAILLHKYVKALVNPYADNYMSVDLKRNPVMGHVKHDLILWPNFMGMLHMKPKPNLGMLRAFVRFHPYHMDCRYYTKRKHICGYVSRTELQLLTTVICTDSIRFNRKSKPQKKYLPNGGGVERDEHGSVVYVVNDKNCYKERGYFTEHNWDHDKLDPVIEHYMRWLIDNFNPDMTPKDGAQTVRYDVENIKNQKQAIDYIYQLAENDDRFSYILYCYEKKFIRWLLDKKQWKSRKHGIDGVVSPQAFLEYDEFYQLAIVHDFNTYEMNLRYPHDGKENHPEKIQMRETDDRYTL